MSTNISLLVLDHQLGPKTVYFGCSYIQKLKNQILFCRHFRKKVVYVTAGPGSAAPPQIGLISCKLNTCKFCHHPNLPVTKLAWYHGKLLEEIHCPSPTHAGNWMGWTNYSVYVNRHAVRGTKSAAPVYATECPKVHSCTIILRQARIKCPFFCQCTAAPCLWSVTII